MTLTDPASARRRRVHHGDRWTLGCRLDLRSWGVGVAVHGPRRDPWQGDPVVDVRILLGPLGAWARRRADADA